MANPRAALALTRAVGGLRHPVLRARRLIAICRLSAERVRHLLAETSPQAAKNRSVTFVIGQRQARLNTML
jgi:hypothetical protein